MGTLGSGHLKNYKKKVGMTQHVLVFLSCSSLVKNKVIYD